MRYLSVCSGIEAASVAWESLGWTPVGFAEIDAFPSRVLDHHYPDVKNYGDLTKYKDWNIERGSVDVLIGGTPCQSFSVAGLRKGMDDPRGNLALAFVGLVDHIRPEWVIWENVPGVLSSNRGRDFGAFVGALVSIGYSVSWRVLDAQYFGVAQRRRRVFVVAHSSGDWRYPSSVLFERESVCRNPAEGRSKRKTTSANAEASTGSDSEPGVIAAASGQAKAEIMENDLSPTLTCRKDYPYIVDATAYRKSSRATSADGYETWVEADVSNTLNCFDIGDIRSTHTVVQAYETHPADSRVKEMGETCQTVVARFGTGGGNTPIVSHTSIYSVREDAKVNTFSATESEVANCLQAAQPATISHHAINYVVQAFPINTMTMGGRPDQKNDSRMTLGVGNDGDPQFTLLANHSHAVAQTAIPIQDVRDIEKKQNGMGIGDDGDSSYTLDSMATQGVAHVFKVRGEGHYSGVAGGTPKPGGGGAGYMGQDECAYTIATTPDQYVAHDVGAFKLGQSAQARSLGYSETLSPTLMSTSGGNSVPAVHTNMIVRRLTPVECERLQGFPDGYTDISWYKSKAGCFREELGKYGCPEEQNAKLETATDGARFKALGNSMAVPVIRWLGEQITKANGIIRESEDG